MKKIVDYTLSENEINELSDRELSELLMYTDRDRKEVPIAEDIYWICIKVINRRIKNENNLTH